MRAGRLVAGLVFAGIVGWTGVAEAQARGTLQASARVVDTRQGLAALSAARAAVQPVSPNSRIENQNTVVTVARERRVLVVTVSFARN